MYKIFTGSVNLKISNINRNTCDFCTNYEPGAVLRTQQYNICVKIKTIVYKNITIVNSHGSCDSRIRH